MICGCRNDSITSPMVSANRSRLQPHAARNARIEHVARIEGAPLIGCEPWLSFTPSLFWYIAKVGHEVSTKSIEWRPHCSLDLCWCSESQQVVASNGGIKTTHCFHARLTNPDALLECVAKQEFLVLDDPHEDRPRDTRLSGNFKSPRLDDARVMKKRLNGFRPLGIGALAVLFCPVQGEPEERCKQAHEGAADTEQEVPLETAAQRAEARTDDDHRDSSKCSCKEDQPRDSLGASS